MKAFARDASIMDAPIMPDVPPAERPHLSDNIPTSDRTVLPETEMPHQLQRVKELLNKFELPFQTTAAEASEQAKVGRLSRITATGRDIVDAAKQAGVDTKPEAVEFWKTNKQIVTFVGKSAAVGAGVAVEKQLREGDQVGKKDLAKAAVRGGANAAAAAIAANKDEAVRAGKDTVGLVGSYKKQYKSHRKSQK